MTVPKVEPISNEVSKLNEITTMADTNPGLMNQIAAGGFKLKKVVTVEKTGIDFLKKKEVSKGNPTDQKGGNTASSSSGGGNKTGDFMSEMKKKMELLSKK